RLCRSILPLICARFSFVPLMWVASHVERRLSRHATGRPSSHVQRRTRMPTVTPAVTRRHAVAAGVAAMTALATGCSTNTEVPPPKQVDAFDWKNFSGESLSLLMSEHPVSIAVREHLPEFEELTGITVSLETLSETDYMVKLLTELQSGAGSYDAFMSSQ